MIQQQTMKGGYGAPTNQRGIVGRGETFREQFEEPVVDMLTDRERRQNLADAFNQNNGMFAQSQSSQPDPYYAQQFQS